MEDQHCDVTRQSHVSLSILKSYQKAMNEQCREYYSDNLSEGEHLSGVEYMKYPTCKVNKAKKINRALHNVGLPLGGDLGVPCTYPYLDTLDRQQHVSGALDSMSQVMYVLDDVL